MQKYDISDGYYVFIRKEEDDYGSDVKKKYRIKIEIVDNIFKDFSKH
ncbi:hypothetical protein M0R04_07850 [Candidatus Dojkabacteria bacterium]|jgi:hypothetical protein|nr:hypothetical protein [Candidatus Dojkabacteria bacterium]